MIFRSREHAPRLPRNVHSFQLENVIETAERPCFSDRLLATTPTTEAGRKLAQAIRKCRGDLFVFVTRRGVPATNNDCERALRPSVIFRKVTGGFRSKWGAHTYAAAASVIATGKLHGQPALQALRHALAGQPILIPP
jgi:transposase